MTAIVAERRPTPADPFGTPRTARRRLRVCMVHYSDFDVDSRIQRQARALAERGDEVDLICLTEPGERRFGKGVIRVHQAAVGKARGCARSYLSGYLGFFASALVRLTALDTRRRYDVVEVHNMPDFLAFTAIAPKLRGTPIILNLHDTFPELFATKFGRAATSLPVRLVYAQERLSAGFADALVTVTAEAADRLASRSVSSRRNAVIMNSPDDRLFGPQRAPVAFPCSGPVRAIYHGGLASRFGVELLIDAVGLLVEQQPPFSLRICGGGPERARLAARAAEQAPGRIDISADSVPFEEIPWELEQSHIGIVPTRRDTFTELLLPVKLLEYVHMGLPAITPRLPVIERYFAPDEVMYFEPDSPESLAQAITATLADPSASRARAARAAARLAGFSWAAQKQRYLELVDGLAEGHARRPTSDRRDRATNMSSRRAQ